jgi:tetratricopeptide (TPR) repeat protein
MKKSNDAGNMIRLLSVWVLILLPVLVFADSEKQQRKQLEAQAKVLVEEAKTLEKQDHLIEARTKFAEAQGITPTREAEAGAYRLEMEMAKRVKKQMDDAKRLYEGGKYRDAINSLNKAAELQPGNPSLNYNLTLCYLKMEDRVKAVEYLGRTIASTNNSREREKLEQLKVSIITGENTEVAQNKADKLKIAEFNTLASKIDVETEGTEEEQVRGEASADSSASDPNHRPEPAVHEASLKTTVPTAPQPHEVMKKSPEVNLCDKLKELQSILPQSPAVVFNLARCAEQEGRTEESVQLFNKYLQLSPNATDGQDVQLKIEDLSSLVKISDSKGAEVRKLYAAASRDLDNHKYGLTLAAYQKADAILPDFPQTKHRLALMYEMLGNVDKSREYFSAYRGLATTDSERSDADAHLNLLDEKRKTYQQNVNEAKSVLSELLDRWAGIEPDNERASGRLHLAKHMQRLPSWRTDIAPEYAQRQLDIALGKLQTAQRIFPLGVEANEMLAFVYMQGNNSHVATLSFDAVSSQNIPVFFYGEMYDSKNRKSPQHVKCELTYDTLRIVDIGEYDPKAKMYNLPALPAGSDGLGNFVQAVDNHTWANAKIYKIADLKQVETKNMFVRVGLGDGDLELSPLNLTGMTVFQGPAARKFANPYTKLFRDYLGIEDAKLGKEGMTGGEKFMMGVAIAGAGLSAYSAIASAGTMMTSTQTMFAMSSALNASVATLQSSMLQERQLLADTQFKLIPQDSFQLNFQEDLR